MKSNSISRVLIPFAVIIFGFAAVYGLSNFLESTRPPLPDGYADGDLALQGKKLKGFSFGAEGLIADWYWMQALQYVGNKALNSKQKVDIENLKPLNPRLLYPYLDNASDLDPRFLQVYFYGSIVLPAIDEEQAIKFIEKGIRDNPNDWRFYQHLGYVYWKLGNYEKAAEAYENGSKIEGSAPFLKLMAGKMSNEGGSRETGRALYRQMYEEATDINIKNNAVRWLFKLDADEQMEAIRHGLQDFKQKTGRCPHNFAEIFPLLRTVKFTDGNVLKSDNGGNLLDPTGVPYLLDKDNCDINIDYEKSNLPR